MKAETTKPLDPVWEEKYQSGHSQRYPWDAVVSFIFRNANKQTPRNKINVLEVGCGTGSNLWFCANEGFSVFGTDGSSDAIAAAIERFDNENLAGRFKQALFPDIPFENTMFDLVIDRAAITCVPEDIAKATVKNISKRTNSGGRIFSSVYAKEHSSYDPAKELEGGLTVGIDRGTLAGFGAIRFYSAEEIVSLFEGWQLIALEKITKQQHLNNLQHVEWHIVAEKRTEP